jgi:XRE family transcriptional regulator, aerobic/anaerobic benzoate catabolism transcriptional regulator
LWIVSIVSDLRAKEKRSDPRRLEAEPPEHALFVTGIGRLVRLSRAKRGMTRRQLAQDSGASERYLAQIESGQGNPSVLILKSIAEALDVPIIELLPRANGRPAAMTHVLDVLARTPIAELPALAELIESHAARHVAADRAQRIALVGLRGAGKSTLGRRLAEQLACPFIELDRLVEQDYGARIPDLIEMAGLATFRRYERACLERVIDEHDTAVIATAGGIVSNAETYALLLRRTHSVWIKAHPDEHMNRVMEQGDFRPMAQNREAMADLVAILDARQADYARAQAELDTSGDTVERSFEKLQDLVKRWLDDKRDIARPSERRIESGAGGH